MAGKLTLKLTVEQQQQIKAATGKELKELNFDSGSELTDADLQKVAGGHKGGKITGT